MITLERLHEIGESLDNENVSYSELAELDNAAEELHLDVDDQMTAIDTYLAIKDKLS